MALVNNNSLQELSALPQFAVPHLHCISQAQERDLKSLELLWNVKTAGKFQCLSSVFPSNKENTEK